MSLIGAVEEGLRREVTDFSIGDTVRVFVKVVEGSETRSEFS